MTTDSRAQIEDFYDHVQTLSQESLAQQSNYVDMRTFNPKTPQALLRLNTLKTAELQQNYGEVQEAFFDFAGRCIMCENPEKHVHSTQGSPVLELKGFPGLYIYPRLLGNPLVYKQLVDTLLHHELADPRNQTNLHEQYHITYPDTSHTGGTSTSYFATGSSQSKMQPRLLGEQDWMTPPITSREFVEKLRWLTLVDGVPSKIKELIRSILPYEIGNGTAYISSSQEPLRSDRAEAEQSTLIDISLGCDGIVVVGLEGAVEADSGVPTSIQPELEGSNDDWRGLVDGLESAQDDDTVADARTSEAEGKKPLSTPSTASAVQLAAIHVRSTDVLVFTGRSRAAWHGVAKVLEGSSPPWEQRWPCWGGSDGSRAMDSWRGCMKGRRIDLVFQ